jgi:NADH-quinone oxidoreductase subunit A
VTLLLALSFFLVKQKPDMEKLSAYECGFNPYEDARLRFEIRFFLVGLLFIIFDLEVAFLLP